MRVVERMQMQRAHHLVSKHISASRSSISALPAAKRFYQHWFSWSRSQSAFRNSAHLPNACLQAHSSASLRSERSIKHGLQYLHSLSSICKGHDHLRQLGSVQSERRLHSSSFQNRGDDGTPKGVTRGSSLQPVDYTTLAASCFELDKEWLPSKVERITQTDKHTVAIGLRTLKQNGEAWCVK